MTMSCITTRPTTIRTSVQAVAQWTMANGQDIPESARIRISSTSDSKSELTLSPVLKTDTGPYTCKTYFEPVGDQLEYLKSSPSNSAQESHQLTVGKSDLCPHWCCLFDSCVHTAPFIVQVEDKVVTRRNQNVTLACFPKNRLIPVLWTLE